MCHELAWQLLLQVFRNCCNLVRVMVTRLVYSGYTGCKEGNTLDNMPAHTPTYLFIYIYPPARSWEEARNWRTQRKPTRTRGSNAKKLHIDSNQSSGLNWSPWSYVTCCTICKKDHNNLIFLIALSMKKTGGSRLVKVDESQVGRCKKYR